MDRKSGNISRREFVVNSAIGGAGLVIGNELAKSHAFAATSKSAAATLMVVPFESGERVRLGIIGVGGRGTSLLRDLPAVDGVEVKAICDLVPEKVAHASPIPLGSAKATGTSRISINSTLTSSISRLHGTGMSPWRLMP